MHDDRYKDVIISSLAHLSGKGKIDVFAFVVMPNHIHLIWRMNEMNGKESAHGSFLKFTAHEFKKMQKMENLGGLASFKVEAINKNYEFWQRDSLAVPLYSKKMALQKLDYIHNNPLQERWNLAADPSDYKYSSAAFYEKGENTFPFLKHLLDEF
ncbi:hypothetical protein C900_03199 [Fulvivirga imtechensis AK7]|uniref:Transposase IS200-like domain-containing protein n=2 Tax=Fulvivirga TaxID=396811 RepID=L8JPM7_9BACT|nr:hypothetical protein C900_03199 [Fulvivirga imtechensis AK7]